MALALLGCGREPAVPAAPIRQAFEIVVEPAHLQLQAGGTGQLSAQANDNAGQPIGGASIRFRAADTKLLRVTDQGLVTSVGPATAQTQVVVISGRLERLVPVVVVPGPPQRVEKLSGDGQQVVAGEVPPALLVARVLDGSGNPLAGVTLTVESAAGAVAPAELVTADDGSVRLQVPRLTRAGADIVVMRSHDAPGVAESFQILVAPGPPSELQLEQADGTSLVPSRPGDQPTLKVTDAFGNPVADVALTVQVEGDAGAAINARTDSAGNLLLPVQAGKGPLRLHVQLTDSPAVKATFEVHRESSTGAGPAS
jgi:hypothetical protein